MASSIYLLLAVAFGALGWWWAYAFRRKYGVLPWGWPPIVWAIPFFISLLLGVILFLIARAVTLRRIQRPAPGSGGLGDDRRYRYGPYAGPYPDRQYPPHPGASFPGRPGPEAPAPGASPDAPKGEGELPAWPAEPASTGAAPADAEAAVPAGAETEPAGAETAGAEAEPAGTKAEPRLPPPGWHPDPSGRFRLRWWDGTRWTEHISN